MRDIAVTLVILFGLAYCFKRPHFGILIWSWLSYMNPHRLCYGFAYSMPYAQITAIVTTLAYLFSKENKKLPSDKIILLYFIFIIWMGLTTIYAFDLESAKTQYFKIIKIQYPIILTMLMINTQKRINQLIFIIIISIGYFGIKGGIFTLMTGGSFRVWGPPDSFIEENNALAVATLMVMPLMVYMRSQVAKYWQRQLILVSLVFMSFSVLGSQSRGAFIAIVFVGAYFWMYSKNKLSSGISIALFLVVVVPFLPESWYERMSTIDTYDEDASAIGRLDAWTLAFRVANHNFLGGGLNFWSPASYSQYIEWFDPLKMEAYVAHSIYLSVLGEHGWIGLFLFLLIFYCTWLCCGQIFSQCNNNQEVQWLADLARMIKISFLAYFSGGAFLSLSYYDLPWHLVSIVILLKEIMLRHFSLPYNKDVRHT